MKSYITLLLFSALFFANLSFASSYIDSAEGVFHIDNISYNDNEMEGFSLKVETQVSLTTLLGDPLTNSTASWDFIRNSDNKIQVNFIPYGQSEIISLNINPDNFKNLYPFNMELEVFLGKHRYYIYDPGLIAETPKVQSYNIPSGYSWDSFLQSVSGSFFGAKENKYFYKNTIEQNGLSISNLSLKQVHFNLIEVRSWHAKQVNSIVVDVTSHYYKSLFDALQIEVTLNEIKQSLKNYRVEDIIAVYNDSIVQIQEIENSSADAAKALLVLYRQCIETINSSLGYYLSEEEIAHYMQSDLEAVTAQRNAKKAKLQNQKNIENKTQLLVKELNSFFHPINIKDKKNISKVNKAEYINNCSFKLFHTLIQTSISTNKVTEKYETIASLDLKDPNLIFTRDENHYGIILKTNIDATQKYIYKYSLYGPNASYSTPVYSHDFIRLTHQLSDELFYKLLKIQKSCLAE